MWLARERGTVLVDSLAARDELVHVVGVVARAIRHVRDLSLELACGLASRLRAREECLGPCDEFRALCVCDRVRHVYVSRVTSSEIVRRL